LSANRQTSVSTAAKPEQRGHASEAQAAAHACAPATVDEHAVPLADAGEHDVPLAGAGEHGVPLADAGERGLPLVEAGERGQAGRPMRADARRNHDKIVAAAREAFAECGASTSLEAVARRAGVGIGTLYRHFPTRQALLEAVYLGEVQQLCAATRELLELPPWESFAQLGHRLVGYLATKKALAQELMSYVDREAAFFQSARADLFVAGEPILRRAQEAGVVRSDTDFTEMLQLLGGIAKLEETVPGQREHLLTIALDGFRRQPGSVQG
jgi:AcrR family transcriptional regulator